MAEERKTTLEEAMELARTIFNSMPYEQRKRLGAPDDRLREINALIEKGDYLSMAHLKKRKKELEDWLIDWYKEICKKFLQVPETCKENDNSFTSLEEAADNYITPIENDEGLDYINFSGRDVRDAFIEGARWQKAEMMKDAVEGYIIQWNENYQAELIAKVGDEFKHGDKVKIIIVKSDEGI